MQRFKEFLFRPGFPASFPLHLGDVIMVSGAWQVGVMGLATTSTRFFTRSARGVYLNSAFAALVEPGL